MISEPSSSVVGNFLDTIVADGRATAAKQFLTEDPVITINGTEYSREAYLDRLRTSDERFDILDITLEDVIESDQRVGVRHEIHFEHSNTAFGVEPNDTDFIETSASLFHIEDDSIVRLDIVHDPTATLEALGLLSEDPTTEKLRDQYYEVLNRVLRHNLRNQLNIIHSNAELVEQDPEVAAERIKRKTEELLTTVEKAREIQRTAIFPTLECTEFPLRDALGPILETYEQRAAVTCEYENPETPCRLRSDKELLRNIVEEAVENAVLYNDAETTTVRIEAQPVTSKRDGVEIRITDNGPGIPDTELEPLQRDNETELLHGSGIGLWIIKWGATRLDGQVTFAENDPSEVKIVLPTLQR
jgi:signal transduction histidine kinase